MSESILATNTPPPAATTPPPAGNTPSWRDSLPEDIRGDATLGKYNDLPSLANAHISLQKMVGTDKIPVPGKNASEADWQGVFKKLGLPESVDKYELKAPEGSDPKFLTGFKEQALKAGVLPQQAQKLMEWYNATNQEAVKQMQTQKTAQAQEGVDALKKEWGEGWDKEVAAAKAGVEWAGIDKEYLNKTGLGNDPAFIKMMNKVGKALAEDKIKGEGATAFGMTPDEAQGKINSIMADGKHAYFDSNHPDHKRAIQEMNRLFQAIHR